MQSSAYESLHEKFESSVLDAISVKSNMDFWEARVDFEDSILGY